MAGNIKDADLKILRQTISEFPSTNRWKKTMSHPCQPMIPPQSYFKLVRGSGLIFQPQWNIGVVQSLFLISSNDIHVSWPTLYNDGASTKPSSNTIAIVSSSQGIQPTSIDTNQAKMCHNPIQEIPQE